MLSRRCNTREKIHQEVALQAPMLPLCRRNSCLALLEKGPAKVARPPRELWPLKHLPYALPPIHHDDRRATDKDGEDVTVLLGQVREGLAQVLHVEVGQRAEEGDTGRTRRKLFGPYRGLREKVFLSRIL